MTKPPADRRAVEMWSLIKMLKEQKPFRPFDIMLDGGQRLCIESPRLPTTEFAPFDCEPSFVKLECRDGRVYYIWLGAISQVVVLPPLTTDRKDQ
jgi:hypothetical protein